jgi:hypothetical protein
MEIMNTKEVLKIKDKNLHLFLYEDVPVNNPSTKIKSMLRPIMDCDEVGQFEESAQVWNFPIV